MISLYKSTNVNNYVPFDIILAIAFPLLIYSSIVTNIKKKTNRILFVDITKKI